MVFERRRGGMGRSGLIPRLSPIRSLGMRLGQNEVQECASKKGSLYGQTLLN